MSAVLHAPATCSPSDQTSSRTRSRTSLAARTLAWSRARRIELGEYLVLSLALHTALVFWASITSPRTIERAPEDEDRAEPFTISIAALLARPPTEEPIQVASLAQQTPPPPVALDRADDSPVPPTSSASIPPPVAQRAEITPDVAPPPPAPPRGETLAESRPSETSERSSEPPPSDPPRSVEPAPEAQVETKPLDEPPPTGEASSRGPQPEELGTPEGGVDPAPAADPATPAPTTTQEPHAPRADESSAETKPKTDGEPSARSDLDLPVPSRPVVGPGPGTAPPATPAPTPAPAPQSHAVEPPPAKKAEGRTLESCMQDPELMAQAHRELTEGSHKGLTTVLLASPEEQLEIARYFGEELVLVPRATLAAGAAPRYYRLADAGSSGVETVASAPPLVGHHQYRDLFDYEYARLPAPLRDLRRSVPAREDVYLFAALLSPPEWALVIARRQEALERVGRDLSTVRQFVLRYARGAQGTFDLRVVEIVFGDGTRVRSGETEQGVR